MSDQDPNRRQFVIATAALTCAAVACECCAAEADAKEAEKEEKEGAGAPESKSVDAGPLANYNKDGITDKFSKKPDRVMLIRHEGKLYAPSAICSHKKCTIKIKDGSLACPCHGSKFTHDGKPTKGPAKTPLLRYAISTNESGNVIVDKTKTFEEKDWGNEAAFIKVG